MSNSDNFEIYFGMTARSAVAVWKFCGGNPPHGGFIKILWQERGKIVLKKNVFKKNILTIEDSKN